MHNEMNEQTRSLVIKEIADLIASNQEYDYKHFIKYLDGKEKYNLKGHMLLNKFVYGSLVKEAMNEYISK